VRILLIAVLAALGSALPAAGAPGVGTFQYRVEPDARKCVSPLCGGYWVTLVNHSRTACSDGVLRKRCYVARAVDSRRQELGAGWPTGTIVRADLESRRFAGFGELGVLVVADSRRPAGREPTGPVFRVRDLGIRCVQAPCFSLRAARLNKPRSVTLSDLDLRTARLSERDRDRAVAALSTPGGLFASGRVVRTEDGGRKLVVTRVYLRAALPRG
jgi:hypothetical protein